MHCCQPLLCLLIAAAVSVHCIWTGLCRACHGARVVSSVVSTRMVAALRAAVIAAAVAVVAMRVRPQAWHMHGQVPGLQASSSRGPECELALQLMVVRHKVLLQVPLVVGVAGYGGCLAGNGGGGGSGHHPPPPPPHGHAPQHLQAAAVAVWGRCSQVQGSWMAVMK